jgi:SM-20-related protein
MILPPAMRAISRLLKYDEALDEMVPAELRYFPSPAHDYPLFIEPRFLSPLACDALVDDMLTNGSRKTATVGSGQGFVNKEIRNTDFLRPGYHFQAMYVTALRELMPRIEVFFGMKLVETTETQAYGYPPGGHYVMHADNCVQERDAEGRLVRWRADRLYRTISGLCYLTDSVDEISGYNQCIGGKLIYPFLLDENGQPFEIVPRKGMFVAFPSNPYFAHQVMPVTAGYRVVIVSWYSRGEPGPA